MERIFKIKTKTDRIPQSQYPSERRYSASIVLGLSVVFSHLFLCAILMGTLIIHKLTVNHLTDVTSNRNETVQEEPIDYDTNISTAYPSLNDINIIWHHNSQAYINVPTLLCSGCYLMAFGFFFAFGTGVLAWKRWYIDRNITLFFVASTSSAVISGIELLFSLLTCVNSDFDYDTYVYKASESSPITFSLCMNIVILATIGSMWSFLATRVAYVGMKSSYPDDIVLGKGRRRVEVSTVKKGIKNGTAFPPDILEHFPSGDKLAKYLPRKENGNLPKAESTLEYRQRVDRFLSETPDLPAHKSSA